MQVTRKTIFYIDFLRFIAVIAVIAIHVLAPLRDLYSETSEFNWLAAAGINSLSRWAVPVFMLISGALLLSTEKPFHCERYLSKRLSKIAIPFIGWSCIYALVTGFMVDGVFTAQWESQFTVTALESSPNTPVWYHLWFFYDFIPLYFVIPFLVPLLKKATPVLVRWGLFSWGILLLMHWLKVESFLQQNLILYSGYLVLGWYLFNRDNRPQLPLWICSGVMMMTMNFLGTWQLALENGAYSSFFMGYKTLNTAVIGGMLFVVAQTYAERIRGKCRTFISTISTYSLGIYLMHPLFLIPVHELKNGIYDWFNNYWLAIFTITIMTLSVSLLCTMLLVKIPIIKRLVP